MTVQPSVMLTLACIKVAALHPVPEYRLTDPRIGIPNWRAVIGEALAPAATRAAKTVVNCILMEDCKSAGWI